MTLRQNEIASTLSKAARGAGWPQGLAEDLAAVTPWMTASAYAQAAAELQDPFVPAALIGTTLTLPSVIAALPSAIDLFVAGTPIQFEHIPQSDLAQAYLAQATARGTSISLKGNMLVAVPTPPPVFSPPDQATWSILQVLAAKTYVPASPQSRAGAGAGLTDND